MNLVGQMLLVGVAGCERQVGQATRRRVATGKVQESLHAKDPQQERRPVAERCCAPPVQLALGETGAPSQLSHRSRPHGAKARRRLQRDLIDAQQANVQTADSILQLRRSSLVVGPGRHPLQQFVNLAIAPQLVKANPPVAQRSNWDSQGVHPRMEPDADRYGPTPGADGQRSCLGSGHPDRSLCPVHVNALVREQRAGVPDVSLPRAAELACEVGGWRTFVEPSIDGQARRLPPSSRKNAAL